MWFRIELFIYLAIVIINMLFLLFRGLFGFTEQLDFSEASRKLPETDTVESLLTLMNNFTNAVLPLLVTFLVIFTAAREGDHGNPLLFLFFFIQAWNLITMFYLCFGNWKNCKWGPKLALGLTIITFLIFPII